MLEEIILTNISEEMGDSGPDPGLPLPPDVSYDEKKSVLHKLDSLSLLLYTFLLTLTVVTIWLFKHRSGAQRVTQSVKRVLTSSSF